MLNPIPAVVAGLRRLIERSDGSVAIIFALCAIPIFIAAGMAIDVGRAYAVKVRLGAALDAAALAVGSETNQTAAQLAADMQNYFTANYPSTALGTNVSVTPVPANADLTATTVNYQAQATVPMTLMRIIGVNSITVTATAQTQKTTGLEIAVVLDNTGSMLCGPNDGAPNYAELDMLGGRGGVGHHVHRSRRYEPDLHPDQCLHSVCRHAHQRDQCFPTALHQHRPLCHDSQCRQCLMQQRRQLQPHHDRSL